MGEGERGTEGGRGEGGMNGEREREEGGRDNYDLPEDCSLGLLCSKRKALIAGQTRMHAI